MLRLHTDNLDPARLQTRLETLLDQGFRRVPDQRYAPAPLPISPLRRLLRRWAWARRARSGLTAWKLSGWSLRWLVRRTPLLGPLAWQVWGKLTLRGFRQHVLSELDKASAGRQQLQADVARLEAALDRSQARERQLTEDLAEKLALEARHRQEGLARTAADIRRLESRAVVAQAAGAPGSNLFPAWYLALENTCRGDVEDIGARLARYLPDLDCAQVGQAGWPVLDLGCGRGEWLKLLGENRLAALGVDSNPAMLEEARRDGLHVVEADLIAFLRATDAESIGAVTAFQVVEHLDQNTLLELFQQAWRVLRPGGVLLLETPNPENLQVAAYSFWLDPTHVRPIPPPLLVHSAAYFGFIDIRIERSNAWSDALRLADASDAARHLEKLLFSGQDYALLARKPYAEDAAPALAGN